jgi:hypothetical protein
MESCEDCPKRHNEFCTKDSTNNADTEVILEWHKEFFPEQYVITGDPVNHPSHYTKGKIEVADFIADQKLNFDRGNAVKYICRAGFKDPSKEIQDLEKALWYINHEIKILKGEHNNGTEENA